MTRIGLAVLVATISLAGCNSKHDYMAEGFLYSPASCAYEEASYAAKQTADAYYSASAPGTEITPELKAIIAELGHRKDAAERAKQDAKECEDRAREWSDLRAQWQNSRAAINIAYLTDEQISWTVVEVGLLIATLAGGLLSLMLSQRALHAAEAERLRQEQQFNAQLDSAYRGMVESRRIAEQQTRAYVLPVKASFEWKDGDVPEFIITYRNAGQTPAISVSECILFSGDQRPPARDHSRAYVEKPIVGGGTIEATTIIPETLRPNLSKSRAIGRTIAEGGDVWAYVFYADVYGNKFVTGAQLSAKTQFIEGASDPDMTIFFADEASFFFEQIHPETHEAAMLSRDIREAALHPTRYQP